MKLLDFLKSLDVTTSPLSNADPEHLDSERQAIIGELENLLEMLGSTATSDTAREAILDNSRLAAIDIAAIFDIEPEQRDENLPLAGDATRPQHQLTQSLLDELRQLQQRALRNPADIVDDGTA